MATCTANTMLSFGEWVQQRRTALDLTRSALARKVGCSPITIKKIERDERRPSRQIAALLAEHLFIPDQDREHFIQMARGEYVATTRTLPGLIARPPFLRADQAIAEPPLRLVTREHELQVLTKHLARTLTGNGNILLITGEAGDGKTMLAHAFVRQCLEQHPDLVVATGNGNAYTGIGDPYLLFREILELLTGDIESRWAAGNLSITYVERLWHNVPFVLESLVEVAPDLVDTLLAGAPLLERAKAVATRQSSTIIAQLQTLVSRQEAKRNTPQSLQFNLFAQYTRLLQTIAHRQPLLLVLDDLQWADSGSISLLFHLARHLQGYAIMIIGIYRAAEVALGRGLERHPLEPIVNELQRIYGDIHIQLSQTDSRQFVDALIDSEPNQLDPSFRDALYRQTAGHPLFTVEMLHGLQERGDLMQNAQGEWIESPHLAWEILPARVEGLTKERVQRLSPDLQELLQIASVAGETFCAEVIAIVNKSREHEVIAKLSTALDQQQRLIRVHGSQQSVTGLLSHYRFRHILFQQYLYNSLDLIQRAYLHRAIADAMQVRYAGQVNTIAPQLAHHYTQAGDLVQACHWLTVAAELAASIYAHTEAERHYRHAIALCQQVARPADPQQLSQLYRQLGRTLELSAQYDRALTLYREMTAVARQRHDPGMELVSLLAQATIRTTVNFARDPVEGQKLLEQARNLARTLGDEGAEARILWNLLLLNVYTGGDRDQRLAYGEEALTLVRALDLPEQLAFTLHDLFYAYAGLDRWDEARACLHEACALWQELNNLPMLAEAHMRLHWTYLVTGDTEEAEDYAHSAYRLGEESHNLDAQALSHFMLGALYWQRGELNRARATMEEDIAIAEQVNSLTPLIGTRAELALLYGEMGDGERGLALAKQAQAVADEQLPILSYWPHAVQVVLRLKKSDLDGATDLMATLTDYRAVKARFGYMPFMWIRVGLAQGEFALAQGEYTKANMVIDQLYDDMERAGIGYLRPEAMQLQERARRS